MSSVWWFAVGFLACWALCVLALLALLLWDWVYAWRHPDEACRVQHQLDVADRERCGRG